MNGLIQIINNYKITLQTETQFIKFRDKFQADRLDKAIKRKPLDSVKLAKHEGINKKNVRKL